MDQGRNNQAISQQMLLALLRSALWNEKTDLGLFTNHAVDWTEIGRLAMEQTVGVLTLTAALSLPTDLQPPKDWRRKAIAFIERNRRTHSLVDNCVSEAVTSLNDAHIHSVLLKGQAYARAYPSPELRQCGDIDLYVGDHHYRDAYLAAKNLGWKVVQEFKPEAKHCGFELNGVRIELHQVAAILSPETADRKFQKWSRNQLYQSARSILFSNEKVPVPTPTFDVVFVFLHLYHHFLNGGIGLRHICDWTMLLHQHRNEVDPYEINGLLKDFGLLRGWSLFAPIAVRHLGLPVSECPLYDSKYDARAERILSHVFMEGNFGRAKSKDNCRPKGYMAGKLYSFSRHSTGVLRKLWIDPYTISRTYVSYIYRGIARVFNDMMNKGKLND